MIVEMAQRHNELACGGDMHAGAQVGEHGGVGLFLAIGLAQQNHRQVCTQAFGNSESARFKNCQIAAVHERCHVIDIVKDRDVFEFHGFEEPFQARGVFRVLARQKDKVHVLEATEEGEGVVHRRAKATYG